jgi:hypothetical protein
MPEFFEVRSSGHGDRARINVEFPDENCHFFAPTVVSITMVGDRHATAV